VGLFHHKMGCGAKRFKAVRFQLDRSPHSRRPPLNSSAIRDCHSRSAPMYCGLSATKGGRVRDLPRLSGVSKEAIGRLEERGYALIQPESLASRMKKVMLTASFGRDTIATLRSLLEHLIGGPDAHQSPLFRGLDPYPDGWRAALPKREALPHYPMVLHRGGFPGR